MSFFLDMSCGHVTADGRGVLAQGPRRNLTHGHHPNGAGRDEKFDANVRAKPPRAYVVCVDMSRLTGVACWHRSLNENSLTGSIPTELAELSSLEFL